MTASDNFAPVGFRFGTVYELNANGRPKATSPTVSYVGMEFYGPKAYNLTIPNPRQIVHTGKDTILVQDQLPSLEATTAEILVSIVQFDMDALLSAVKKFTVGQFKMILRNTDRQGSEPVVGLLLYQQAKDPDSGLRMWHYHIIPSTQAIPIPSQWNDTPQDHRYSLSPSRIAKHLWGVTLTLDEEGATQAGIFDGNGDHKPFLDNYLGNGSQETFPLTYDSFDTSYAVFVNGVENTTAIKTVSEVDFDGYPPANNADIQIFYGRAS